MCGILAVVQNENHARGEDLAHATHIIRHRGPDDEGFLTWTKGENPRIWAGTDTAPSTHEYWKYDMLQDSQEFHVGLGHRRLSILDLSPRGHQPMIHTETGISMVYNGEVYNFQTIRTELEAMGFAFHTDSDSEVLLLAWVAWGTACIPKLNGMFSFVVLDPRGSGTVYAVRDRFGVKPMYWYRDGQKIVFSSEIKQIRSFPGYKLSLNRQKVIDYLAEGYVDTDDETFDTGIKQLRGGHFAEVDLSVSPGSFVIKRWYQLTPQKWSGDDVAATDRFRELLRDSIRLRLRADVPVGSCLSGGLDSSAIVCLAKEVLDESGPHNGQVTVTACFKDPRFDEWRFAEEVVKKSGAQAERIFPDFERLRSDFDKLLWHQDDPFPSTSMFSQWCVFGGAASAGLKVMVDGQGSDEQLSGYGGNDLALYTGLLARHAWGDLIRESKSYKAKNGRYPKGFLLGALQEVYPGLKKLFPESHRAIKPLRIDWLNLPAKEIARKSYKDLQGTLTNQLLCSPLPSLLRFEDRNSMAFSIESRVPFMDYRLVEFNLGLPEKMVYRDGLKKVVLRRALKGIMPDAIVNRTDKMGFVTPEEVWLREEGTEWFRSEIARAVDSYPDYFNKQETLAMLEQMIKGEIKFSFVPWRIICFSKWMDQMAAYR
jgi:asparagine synthase (glutamine-hydrolysing)